MTSLPHTLEIIRVDPASPPSGRLAVVALHDDPPSSATGLDVIFEIDGSGEVVGGVGLSSSRELERWIERGAWRVRYVEPVRAGDEGGGADWARAEVIVLSGTADSVGVARFLLPEEEGDSLVIGRTPRGDDEGAPDLSLDADVYVSKRHVRLVVRSGQHVLYDLGSKNETQVNGQLVRAPKVLRHGDQVRIGSSLIRYMNFADLLRSSLSADDGRVADADQPQGHATPASPAEAVGTPSAIIPDPAGPTGQGDSGVAPGVRRPRSVWMRALHLAIVLTVLVVAVLLVLLALTLFEPSSGG